MKKSKLGLLFLSSLALVTGVASTGVAGVLANQSNVSVVRAEAVTVTKTVNTLAEENEWSVSSGSTINDIITSFSLDSVITISTSGQANCGSIWGTTTKDWRLYQNKSGDVTVSAAEGYKITSVKFTYSISNTGVLKDGSSSNVTNGSSYATDGSSVTFTVGNTKSGVTNGQVKITAFSVTYDVASAEVNKVLTIGTATTYAQVGQTIQCTAGGTADTSNVTWSVISDNDVASISSSGLVSVTGYGEVLVSATSSDGTEAEDVTLKFYPLNDEEITVPVALDIAALAGATASPYSYSLTAEIGEITDDSFDTSYNNMTFNLMDEDTNIINVFHAKGSHKVAVNDKVKVTGKLQKTTDNTCRFASGTTYLSYYSVSFVNNGAAYGDNVEVLEGNTVSKPTDPTREGYTFNGWADSEGNIWDFTTAISADTTLTASWSNDTELSLQSDINAIGSFMSLAYRYSDNRVKTVSNLSINSSGEHISSSTSRTVSKNTEYDLSSDFSGDDGITIGYNSGTGTNFYFTSSEFRMYTGNTVTVNAPKGKTIFSVTLVNKNGEDITVSTLNISYSNGAATISVTSNLKSVAGMRVEYGSGSIENADFRLKLATGNMTSFASQYGLTNYGVEVSTKTKSGIKFGYGGSTYVDATTNYQYIVLDLGDALNNQSRLTDEFTIRAYAEYNGKFFYSTSTKANSIVGMVKTYYSDENVKESVQGLYDIIDSFGLIK